MKLLKTEIRNLNHLEKAKWLKTLLEQEGYDVRSYEKSYKNLKLIL